MKPRKCPFCKELSPAKFEDYTSSERDGLGKEIVVAQVAIFSCPNKECNFVWLPHDQEIRIDNEVNRRKSL